MAVPAPIAFPAAAERLMSGPSFERWPS